MKRIILSVIISALGFGNTYSQTIVRNNYDTPIGDETIQQDREEHGNQRIGVIKFTFLSFKGGENYGIGGELLNANGIGGEYCVRTDFKSHGNINIDLGLNATYEILKDDDTNFLFTIAAGPSIRMQDELSDIKVNYNQYTGKYTTTEKYDFKFYVDLIVNPRFSLRYKNVLISAGYFMWAPKAKFSDGALAHGFQATLGYVL
ncbi:MAG: hypothetical protein IJV10_02365 [Prevotella sp.]|nr:hypothetical protein [Prevotella sp.]